MTNLKLLLGLEMTQLKGFVTTLLKPIVIGMQRRNMMQMTKPECNHKMEAFSQQHEDMAQMECTKWVEKIPLPSPPGADDVKSPPLLT